MTIEAERTIQDAPDADVIGRVVGGLRALDGGSKNIPPYFDGRDLAVAKRLVGVYGDGVLGMKLKAPRQRVFSPTTKIARTVDELVSGKRPQTRAAYGSVEGKLRQVTVDDRENHEQSGIQIIDRGSLNVVDCQMSADMVERIGANIRKRVVLYGQIRYNESGAPVRIRVENFDVIDGAIPSLEDLHQMGISITGGEDAADYVTKLRGDE